MITVNIREITDLSSGVIFKSETESLGLQSEIFIDSDILLLHTM